jgi:UDP-N-acetylglucosamine:LPS N-acetylglucosamine transferase
MAEIRRIIEDKKEQERMVAGAKKFARPDSAKIIAEQLVAFALKHEL